MPPLPVAVLLGIYLGVLTGIIPAIVAFTLGFLFRYITGVPIPAFAVVVLGVAIAGVNGGLLALVDPTIVSSSAAPTLVPALIVVLMITMYAHDRGTALGVRLPRRVTLRGLRPQSLSEDVVRWVGGRGRVQVRVVGEVGDVEGYPPLTPELRQEIHESEWTLEAAPLTELEAAMADRLRSTFDLADVHVEVDEHARATVRAAPPLSGLSKRVPAGERAVSVDTLVPTGLARGDEVSVRVGDSTVGGTVVSVRSAGARDDPAPPDTGSTEPVPTDTGAAAPAGEAVAIAPKQAARAAADGGPGRLTVAVDRGEAATLLAASDPAVVVRARGTHREFELISLLRRVGLRFRRLPVGERAANGLTLADLDLRGSFGVAVLAVRRPSGWTIAPRGTATVGSGDEVFAVGSPAALDRAAEAIA